MGSWLTTSLQGLSEIIAGIFHITTPPPERLYKALRMGNIETVLASAIAAVFFAAFIVAGTMWYGSAATPVELFGPTRYQWDQSYFKTEINRRVQTAMDDGATQEEAFETIPEKLAFYDYVGNSSCWGGLFRVGPMVNGDGLATAWVGHIAFSDKEGRNSKSVAFRTFSRTSPSFCKTSRASSVLTFPTVVRKPSFLFEQQGVTAKVFGGALDGQTFTDPADVKRLARKAQLGEAFDFDRETYNSDGTFRSSPRGWFTLATPPSRCCSSSATSGTVPAPCTATCSLVLIPTSEIR